MKAEWDADGTLLSLGENYGFSDIAVCKAIALLITPKFRI